MRLASLSAREAGTAGRRGPGLPGGVSVGCAAVRVGRTTPAAHCGVRRRRGGAGRLPTVGAADCASPGVACAGRDGLRRLRMAVVWGSARICICWRRVLAVLSRKPVCSSSCFTILCMPPRDESPPAACRGRGERQHPERSNLAQRTHSKEQRTCLIEASYSISTALQATAPRTVSVNHLAP